MREAERTFLASMSKATSPPGLQVKERMRFGSLERDDEKNSRESERLADENCLSDLRNAERKVIQKEEDSRLLLSLSSYSLLSFNNMSNKDFMAQLNACGPNIVCFFAQGQLTRC